MRAREASNRFFSTKKPIKLSAFNQITNVSGAGHRVQQSQRIGLGMFAGLAMASVGGALAVYQYCQKNPDNEFCKKIQKYFRMK